MLLLLRLGDVEEELEDDDVVLGEMLLEGIDLVVTLPPDRARHEIVHAHHDHVLVMGAVEDPELAVVRNGMMDPPQVVVIPLIVGGNLERLDLDAGGVQPGHDVADGAVLASRVGRLEHDEERALVLGVHEVLELGQA